MLSDDTLQRLSEPFAKKAQELNIYFLDIIGKRVKEIGVMSPTDIKRLDMMIEMGADIQKLNKKIAELSGISEKELLKLYNDIAKDSWHDTKAFADYTKTTYIPYSDNITLQNYVTAITTLTAESLNNLSNSTAIGTYIKNPFTDKLEFKTLESAYKSIIDKSLYQATYNKQNYGSAMRQSLRLLGEKGIQKTVYVSDKGKVTTNRIEVAVRRNVLDGIRQVNQVVQDEIGKTYNTDGKELSVHSNSAPDHIELQGKQFTNEEYAKIDGKALQGATNQVRITDYTGKVYRVYTRPIGIWNCRHFAVSVILGLNKPQYSNERLKAINKRNTTGWIDKWGLLGKAGTKYTLYEVTQAMRKIETTVRILKDQQILLRQAYDRQGAQKVQKEINTQLITYSKLEITMQHHGIEGRRDKMAMTGYRKISVE